MDLDRRQTLALGGLWVATCAAGMPGPIAGGRRLVAGAPALPLDELLVAHVGALPENGGGANHYPMAAEALEALGHGDAIEASWVDGASIYAGELPRMGRLGALGPDAVDGADPVSEWEAEDTAEGRDLAENAVEGKDAAEGGTAAALGDHDRRYGDWLDHFRAELGQGSWQDVVGHWCPRLAPGLVAGAFHGLIRTAHAVRALDRSDTPARRDELAVGLAYWAGRYVELPTASGEPVGAADLEETLTHLDHPWLDDPTDVGFFDVVERLRARPLAPSVERRRVDRPTSAASEQGAPAGSVEAGAVRAGVVPAEAFSPADELAAMVDVTTAAFLEMLVAERHRLWLLHTVTGPAAVGLLLPHVDDEGARRLVAYTRQAVVAMYAAFGEPYTPRAHVREAPPAWPELVDRAVATRSVHTIKLIDALARFDRGEDTLYRSTAVQYLEWV